MKINISMISNLPIYEQIKNQIREQILSGELATETQLPSIRALARELKVGVITTKRVYEDLGKEGILISHAGKGYYVADLDRDYVRNSHLKLLREQLSDIKTYAQAAGFGKEELKEVIDSLFEEDNKII